MVNLHWLDMLCLSCNSDCLSRPRVTLVLGVKRVIFIVVSLSPFIHLRHMPRYVLLTELENMQTKSLGTKVDVSSVSIQHPLIITYTILLTWISKRISTND